MKITDSTFLMLQMYDFGISIKYPFIIVVMEKLYCHGMNKQPQQKQDQDIFRK